MNFATFIERWAQFQPDKTALRFNTETVTYADLWRRIELATLRLASLGVHRGDRVAWYGYNHPELLAAFFACARLGAIFSPLNFRLAPPENLAILEHADVSVLLVEPDFYSHATTLQAARPLMKCVGLRDAPSGWFAWEGVAPSGFTPKLAGTFADDLLIVFTSGTTGKPKGAVHTQQGMLWNIVCSQHTHDFTPSDHVLMALPMFHVGGLCIQTLPALHAGAMVTIQPRFDPGMWLAELAAARPTVSLLVPATVRLVLEHPAWKTTDVSSLRAINMGSSVVPLTYLNAWLDRGVAAIQVYGATETGPVSIVLRPEDAWRKVGSTGKAALHVDVRLTDTDGRDVKPGEVGEILLCAPNMMRGYWNDPDNPAYRDGWFRTGDLARIDADGFYWISGRSKDMIISGGENIYPAEIENILAENPEVVECAVVGQPDAKWGEVAVAVIVRKPGSALSETDVQAMFEGRIARYKHPRRIVFTASLPKTALGKVQKADLVNGLSND